MAQRSRASLGLTTVIGAALVASALTAVALHDIRLSADASPAYPSIIAAPGDPLPPDVAVFVAARNVHGARYLGTLHGTRYWSARLADGALLVIARTADGTLLDVHTPWRQFQTEGASVPPASERAAAVLLPDGVRTERVPGAVEVRGQLVFDERPERARTAITVTDDRDPDSRARLHLPVMTAVTP